MKRKTKNTLIIIVAVILIVATMSGIIALFSSLPKSKGDNLKVISPKFTLGGLTDEGEYKESKRTLYTKDAFECQGLNIELDFESDISYKVFFYRADGSFLLSSDKYKKSIDFDFHPAASMARIVIYPTLDLHEELDSFFLSNYTKQMTIKVSKITAGNEVDSSEPELLYGLPSRDDYPTEMLVNTRAVCNRVDHFAVVDPVNSLEGKTLTTIDVAVSEFSAIDDNQYFTLLVIDSSVLTGLVDRIYSYICPACKHSYDGYECEHRDYNFDNYNYKEYRIYIPKEEITSLKPFSWFSIDVSNYGISIGEGETIALYSTHTDPIWIAPSFSSELAPFYYLRGSEEIAGVSIYEKCSGKSLPIRIYGKDS